MVLVDVNVVWHVFFFLTNQSRRRCLCSMGETVDRYFVEAKTVQNAGLLGFTWWMGEL
jgi:hypothetical protein